MNKEQQDIIELVGQEYTKWFYDNAVPSISGNPILNGKGILTRGQFINKCKTDSEFSEKWGLTIEERELSLEERCSLANFAPFDDRFPDGDDFKWDEHTINIAEDWLKQRHPNLPTKLITVTYNNETIESYE
jgi:hypothetical protein